MKKNTRRLQLRRTTLRTLSDGELGQVAGGTLYYYYNTGYSYSGTAVYVTGAPTTRIGPPPPPTGSQSCP